MPRRARIVPPNVPLHLIQRGNSRQACFLAEEACHANLGWLGQYAKEHGVAIHAWVLMTNHVHLLVSPQAPDAAGRMMKALGQRYVQYFNRSYLRSGTLLEGRFRSCPTEAESYLLACQRYIELNPVRAGMVSHPAEYRWSSYRANALCEPDPLVTPHALYTSLGRTAPDRANAYRELFRHELDPGLIDEIRSATNGNFALGGSRFAGEIAAALGVRAQRGKRGRPRKLEEPENLRLSGLG